MTEAMARGRLPTREPTTSGSVRAARSGIARPEYFAMVMATGIVAAGLRQDGWRDASDVLVAIAAAVWLPAVVATIRRFARCSGRLRVDAGNPGRGFAWYAVVAACVVLGSCLATLGGPGVLAATALTSVAVIAWLVVTGLVAARFLGRSARPGLQTVTATWYLWPVGTQSLAIAAAVLVASGVLPAGPGLIAAIAVWSAGVVLYLATSILVAIRLVRAGPGPAGTRAAYWVVMGAAAISVLAVALILRTPHASAVRTAGPALTVAGLVLWSAGTALYPLLAVLTALWWRRTRRRPGYQPSTWVIVFPIGMYAVASWHLGLVTGLKLVRDIGTVAVWFAAITWAAAFTALAIAVALGVAVRSAIGGLRSRALPHRPRYDRRYTFEALVTVPLPAGTPVPTLPGPGWHGVIRAAGGFGGPPTLFSAHVADWDPHDTGRAGPAEAVATIVALGAEPAACLPVGGTFALWRGRDVARGVVTRRIFV